MISPAAGLLEGTHRDLPHGPDEADHLRRARRDWLADALFFVLGIVFTLLAFVDGVDRQMPAVPLMVDTGLGVVSCLLLWWRRRWPVGVAVIIGVFSVYSLAAAGVALAAVFSLAVHRRFAVVAPVVAGVAAASLATPLFRPDTSMPGWAQALLGVVCVAAALAWGMLIRARRQLTRRSASEQELRISQARQAERHRIAREMHDVLAHRISLLSLHAGALELRPDAPPDEISRAAGVIRDSAHQVLEDLREIIGVLRTDPAGDIPERPQPALAGLPMLIDEARAAGMQVTLDCPLADLTAVPAATGRSAYRIIQEGLTNARKHALGNEVSVTVQGRPGAGLAVEVSNPLPGNISGAPRIPGTGTGLVGLAERAALSGGRLEHGPTANGEFRLWAWLPWPA